ncbi:permease [Halocalculus aciditolerans]|uniref:Putative permease n=1 Tax=Halocalculus aciditolerans TaxID=1383812 RepID=A0A830F466_9EURY|nr:permease [Halocalculus aciditolerans]GGL61689.1 putative permease [Halocalculus aciditolerans]
MVLSQIIDAFQTFFGMAWDTWWALALGFTITGAVETFVTEDQMTDWLGGNDWEEIGLGTALGAASSSCSFAATSTAKSLFKKGASAEASIAGYQFAATDLVAELFLILWILMGWQFVAAEIAGGVVAVVVIALTWKKLVPQSWFDAARDNLMSLEDVECATCGMSADPDDPDTITWTDPQTGATKYFCCGSCLNSYKHMDRNPDEERGWQDRATSVSGWKDASRNTMKEWDMLWDDILIGFVIASLLAAFVPNSWWLALFGGDGGFTWVVTGAILGVVIGIVTFLCSVGNIPFALVLWQAGTPFGAIMSFIYADLLIPPLLNTYRKYYGTRMAGVIFVTFGFASVVAGVAMHYLFAGLGMMPAQGQVGGTAPEGYTLWLNLLFTIVFVAQAYVAWGEDKVNEIAAGVPPAAMAYVDRGKEIAAAVANVLDDLVAALQRAFRLLTSAVQSVAKGIQLLARGVRLFIRALSTVWEALAKLVRAIADAAGAGK